MNTLDIIILIILLIGGLNGLRQGFIKAFANLIGWIFALVIGAKYAVIWHLP
jgi:membrane protein required for colicin V production